MSNFQKRILIKYPLKILKSIFINFLFYIQFQLINILSRKCFKEIYLHHIIKPFGNNFLIINYL